MDKGKKILMLGWEWPPYNSGGLGPASKGIAESLVGLGYELIFVLPRKLDIKSPKIKFVFLEDISPCLLSKLEKYPSSYLELDFSRVCPKNKDICFGGFRNDFVFKTIAFYCSAISELLEKIGDFDYIYHHDWLTFLPAYLIKVRSGKPLISHIHATVYDIGGFAFIDPLIYKIEKMMLDNSDLIITVSDYEKDILKKHYDIKGDNIYVVHNGFDGFGDVKNSSLDIKFLADKKVVLFVGRLSFQKGAEYLIKAAGEVVKRVKNAVFIIVGSGGEEARLLDLVCKLGLQRHFYFTGFLRDEELYSLYRVAHIFVMPSLSEPFGIAALEAASCGIPIILSKNSGVKEVLKNVFLIDFWDTRELSNKLIGLLRYKPLSQEMSVNVLRDSLGARWLDSAKQINMILYTHFNVAS